MLDLAIVPAATCDLVAGERHHALAICDDANLLCCGALQDKSPGFPGPLLGLDLSLLEAPRSAHWPRPPTVMAPLPFDYIDNMEVLPSPLLDRHVNTSALIDDMFMMEL